MALVLCGGIICQHQLGFSSGAVDPPEKSLGVTDFGDPWTSILVDWREDVERGKNARYCKK